MCGYTIKCLKLSKINVVPLETPCDGQTFNGSWETYLRHPRRNDFFLYWRGRASSSSFLPVVRRPQAPSAWLSMRPAVRQAGNLISLHPTPRVRRLFGLLEGGGGNHDSVRLWPSCLVLYRGHRMLVRVRTDILVQILQDNQWKAAHNDKRQLAHELRT